jgi:hypothetical protein
MSEFYALYISERYMRLFADGAGSEDMNDARTRRAPFLVAVVRERDISVRGRPRSGKGVERFKTVTG